MIRILILIGTLVSLCLGPATTAATKRPNILLILADDMGYGDMGFTGSQGLKTPHLDTLAKSGVFCSQAYVCSPVCSPSRAGLLTGRDPRRFGYQSNLNKSSETYATRPTLLGLPPGEHTLGNQLKANGYATCLVGKWHLGTGPGFHPLERGFDFFCGMLKGSHTYFPKSGKNQLERNRKPLSQFSSPYLTDFFTDEAIKWLDKPNKRHQPWFLFLSYNAPHGPLEATDKDLALFSNIKNEKRRIYAAMMHALDRSIGRLLQWLSDRDLEEETLIVFLSDNGGATNNASWNADLSGAKGCLREGGIRVPMIWHWPGTLPAGGKLDHPVSSLDLLPSFMAAAQGTPLPLRDPLSHEDPKNFQRGVQRYGAYDGQNLLPWLKGEARPAKRTLFWRLQGQAAVLDGSDKLIRLSHRPPQLFEPQTDRSEARDLSLSHPDRLQRLFEKLGQWEATLPTHPLWGSSPFWSGQSAMIYDQYAPKPEPR